MDRFLQSLRAEVDVVRTHALLESWITGLTEYGSASSRNLCRSCRDDVACREWREFMKEVRNFRRGWYLASPTRIIVELHNDRLDKCPLRAHSVRIPPSAITGSPGPQRVVRSPVVFLVAPLRWQPVRCAAGLVFLFGAEAPPRVLRWSFLPASTCWTPWQFGLDCNAIAGAQAAGACSRLSSPIPGPRGSRGHTCRTLPRAGSVSASRVG